MGLTGIAAGLALAAAATEARGRWRQSRAEAAFPPQGRFLTVGDRRVHYLQDGTGPDVVLLHGASGSVREFGFGLLAALAARFRVTALDRPGLGWSDPLPGPTPTLAAQAAHLAAACDRLGVVAPLVVGQSFGGSVALAWALAGGPRALVLIGSPSLPWPGDLDIWYRLNRGPLGGLMPWLAAGWIWPGYVRNSLTSIFAPDPVPPGYADTIGTGLTIRRATLAANVAQVNGLRAQLVAMGPQYARLRLPIELIHGEADTIVPIAVHSRPLSERLATARLTALPATGHMPHHSRLEDCLAAIDRAHSRAIVAANTENTHGPAL